MWFSASHGAALTSVMFSPTSHNSSEWDTVGWGRQHALDWGKPGQDIKRSRDLILCESMYDQGAILPCLGLQMNSCVLQDSVFMLFKFNLFTVLLPFH